MMNCMDTIAKADIFFVVATAGTIVFTIVGVVAGIYLVRILREIDGFTKKAKAVGFFIKKLISKI